LCLRNMTFSKVSSELWQYGGQDGYVILDESFQILEETI
jgi:hypothetical protein